MDFRSGDLTAFSIWCTLAATSAPVIVASVNFKIVGAVGIGCNPVGTLLNCWAVQAGVYAVSCGQRVAVIPPDLYVRRNATMTSLGVYKPCRTVLPVTYWE